MTFEVQYYAIIDEGKYEDGVITYTGAVDDNGAPKANSKIELVYMVNLTLDSTDLYVDPADINVKYNGRFLQSWNTGVNGGGTRVTDETKLSDLIGKDGNGAPLRLYANWVASSFTVNYHNGYGDGLESIVYTDYLPWTAENLDSYTPYYSGHSFGGWWTGMNGGGIKVSSVTSVGRALGYNDSAESLTLYANWTDNYITIHYDVDGGTTLNDDTFSVYDSRFITTLANPRTKKTGYVFSGWYMTESRSGNAIVEGSTPSGNGLANTAEWTVHAKWVEATISVKYNANGSTDFPVSKMPADTTVKYGKTLVVKRDPTRTGFTFAGWGLDPKGGVLFTYDEDEDMTAYKVNNPSVLKKTDEGYDLVLYAIWDAIVVNVVYNANDSDDAPAKKMPKDTTVNFGSTLIVSKDPSRTGYRFEGWGLSPDGDVLFTYDEDEDLTYYKVTNLNVLTKKKGKYYLNLYAIWKSKTRAMSASSVDEVESVVAGASMTAQAEQVEAVAPVMSVQSVQPEATTSIDSVVEGTVDVASETNTTIEPAIGEMADIASTADMPTTVATTTDLVEATGTPTPTEQATETPILESVIQSITAAIKEQE